MLRNLQIHYFRVFPRLEIDGFTRVNLLVGRNNSGKSSVLEAIQLLRSEASVDPLWTSLTRRGEFGHEGDEFEYELAAENLFHGRDLGRVGEFRVEGDTSTSHAVLSVRVCPPDDVPDSDMVQAELPLGASPHHSAASGRLELRWSEGIREERSWLGMSDVGGIFGSRTVPRRYGSLPRNGRRSPSTPVTLLGSEGMDATAVVEAFDAITLTDEELGVLNAMRVLEPRLERLASVKVPRRADQFRRGGMVASVGGRRMPLGSLGDGAWRMLGVALGLTRARGGVLLVDEIDTGLHYTSLVDLWRMVLDSAQRLDVQVFATTHSRDCVEALAEICVNGRREVALHRIEVRQERAVSFDEDELLEVGREGLEVR